MTLAMQCFMINDPGLVIFVCTEMTFATMIWTQFQVKLAKKAYIQAMSSHPFDDLSIFQDLNQEERQVLYPLFLFSLLPAGTILFDQGSPAECLYIVIDGEVVIRYKPEDGPALIVAHVHRDGVAGWSAAIGSPIYTSSAVCVKDSELLCIQNQDLRDLCERRPRIGSLLLERLATVVAERLQNTHSQVMALLEQGMGLNVEKSLTTS
jgi:CRP-like cAMP-binding protein